MFKQNTRMPRAFPVWATMVVALAMAVLASWIVVRRVSLPVRAKAFSAYAGSASCRECHREEYDQWAGSHHGLAEQRADSDTCQPAFSAAKTFGPAGRPVEFAVRDGTYAMTMTGVSGRRETFMVDGVIGHDPLVEFLVGAPGGRRQVLSTAWDPRRKEWFDVFGTEERLPGEWGHWTGRGMNWNSMCAACHNTGLRKNYDATNDTYHTDMAEMSVGCESCHGPLQAHMDWQLRSAKDGR